MTGQKGCLLTTSSGDAYGQLWIVIVVFQLNWSPISVLFKVHLHPDRPRFMAVRMIDIASFST